MNRTQRNKRIKELEKETSLLLQEKYSLLAENDIEKYHSFVGKFFRYTNSYGSGENWPYYIACTGIDKEDGILLYWSFQSMPDGKIEINTEDSGNGVLLESKEISAKEFWGAWAELMEKLGSMWNE